MLFKRVRRTVEPITDETISLRAYELWEARGCPESDGQDDWQVAKQQLTTEAEQARRGPLGRFWARLRGRAAL